PAQPSPQRFHEAVQTLSPILASLKLKDPDLEKARAAAMLYVRQDYEEDGWLSPTLLQAMETLSNNAGTAPALASLLKMIDREGAWEEWIEILKWLGESRDVRMISKDEELLELLHRWRRDSEAGPFADYILHKIHLQNSRWYRLISRIVPYKIILSLILLGWP